MHNNGKEYEIFVAHLQQAIINSENIGAQKNIEIELNKKILDTCGIEREFDLYWEYELGGITYKTIIECKDYNSNISVEKIDSLIGKIRDIPDLKPVFATKKGYQSGAKTKAKHNRIELLIVREQNESDWQDKNGNPCIKFIEINMQFQPPARITKFTPVLDGKWAQENTEIDTSQPIESRERNDKVIIEDLEKDTKYSLHDLEQKLITFHHGEQGDFSKKEIFSNAYIYHGDLKLKLISYELEYTTSKPFKQPIHIDFAKELIGVIEYLGKGRKKSIFKQGLVR